MELFKHQYSIEAPIALLDIIENGIFEKDIVVTSDMFQKQTIDTGDWKFGESPASKWKQTIVSSSLSTQSSQKHELSGKKNLKAEKRDKLTCSPKKKRRTNSKIEQKTQGSKPCARQEKEKPPQEKPKSNFTQVAQRKELHDGKVNKNPGQDKQKTKPIQKTQTTKSCGGQSQVIENKCTAQEQAIKLTSEAEKSLFRQKNFKSGDKTICTETVNNVLDEKIKKQIQFKERKEKKMKKGKTQTAKSRDRKEECVLQTSSTDTIVQKSKVKVKSKDMSVDKKDNTRVQKPSNNFKRKQDDNQSLQDIFTKTKQQDKCDKNRTGERKRKQNENGQNDSDKLSGKKRNKVKKTKASDFELDGKRCNLGNESDDHFAERKGKQNEKEQNDSDKLNEKKKNKIKKTKAGDFESDRKGPCNLGIGREDHSAEVGQKKSKDVNKSKQTDSDKLKKEVVFQNKSKDNNSVTADKKHSTVYQLWKSTIGSNQDPFKKSTDERLAQYTVSANESIAHCSVSTSESIAQSSVLTNESIALCSQPTTTNERFPQCSVSRNERVAQLSVSTNENTASPLAMTNEKDVLEQSGQDKYISLQKDSFMYSIHSGCSSTDTSVEMDVSSNEISQCSETLQEESFLKQDIIHHDVGTDEKENALSSSAQEHRRDENIKELKKMLSDLLTPDVVISTENNVPKVETRSSLETMLHQDKTSKTSPESHKLDEVVKLLFSKRKRSKVKRKKANLTNKCSDNIMQKGFGKCSFCGLVCVLGKSMQLHEMTHRSKIMLSRPGNLETNNELSTLIEKSPVKNCRSKRSSKVNENILSQGKTSLQTPCNLVTVFNQSTVSSQENQTGVLLILPREATHLGDGTLKNASPSILLNLNLNDPNFKSLSNVQNPKFSPFRNESEKTLDAGGHYYGNKEGKGHYLDQNDESSYVEPDQDQSDMMENFPASEVKKHDNDAIRHSVDMDSSSNCAAQKTVRRIENIDVKNSSVFMETLENGTKNTLNLGSDFNTSTKHSENLNSDFIETEPCNTGTKNTGSLHSDFNGMHNDRDYVKSNADKLGSCGGCVKILKIIVVKDSLTQEKLEVPVSECQCQNPEMCFQKDSSENSPNSENSQNSHNINKGMPCKNETLADSDKIRTHASTSSKCLESGDIGKESMFSDSNVNNYGNLSNSGGSGREYVRRDSDNERTEIDSGCARTHSDFKYSRSGTCSRTNICFNQFKALKKQKNSGSNLTGTDINNKSTWWQNRCSCCQDDKINSILEKENCCDNTKYQDKHEADGITKSGVEIGQEMPIQAIGHDRFKDLQTVFSDFISPPKKRWRDYLADRMNDNNMSETSKIDVKRNKFKRSINFDSVDAPSETECEVNQCTKPIANNVQLESSTTSMEKPGCKQQEETSVVESLSRDTGICELQNKKSSKDEQGPVKYLILDDGRSTLQNQQVHLIKQKLENNQRIGNHSNTVVMEDNVYSHDNTDDTDDTTDYHNNTFNMQKSPINNNYNNSLDSIQIVDTSHQSNSYHGDFQHSINISNHDNNEVHNASLDVGNEMIFETTDMWGNHDNTGCVDYSPEDSIDDSLDIYDFHIDSCARVTPYTSDHYQCARVTAIDFHNSARTRPIKLHRIKMSVCNFSNYR